MRLPDLRSRTRSLMAATLVVAVVVWGAVFAWRRNRLLELSRRFEVLAAEYGRAEVERADALSLVADLERAVASAEPPAPGSDHEAWRAYRGHLSDLQRAIENASGELDQYGGYRALRRHSERLAEKYRDAAARP
jgi:hypothetical protein